MTRSQFVYEHYFNLLFHLQVIFPDLALVRLTLYDDNRQLIGQRVLPFSSIHAGYRYVSLRSPSNVPLDSATLFVRFGLGIYVADSFRGNM